MRQLLRIAEQHEVAGRGAHGDRIGERQLTRLVDEEVVQGVVHLVWREAVRRARHQGDVRIETVFQVILADDICAEEL